ncbi:MAG TPA: hypothetical protein VGD81_11565 [Opitutaceae bacterium]
MILLLLVACLALTSVARATLDSALQAQEMLGRETWSRVLKIRNSERLGVYPAIVYATVFEFNGILWFFTEADGTQSLSLYKNRLEQDKAGLGPLLLAISPGFRSFVELPDRAGPGRSDRYPKLRNGCFVESVHALRRLQAQGKRIVDARLLLFYLSTTRGTVGHTGLVFTTADGHFYWDPEAPARVEPVANPTETAPIEVVRDVVARRDVARIQRALFVPVRGLTRSGPQLASAPLDDAPVGGLAGL